MSAPPAPAPPPPPPPPPPVQFPEVWSSRHDLPGLPWCLAKGAAKGIILIFFAVLLPIEILYTVLGASDLELHHSITVALLIYGGGALAVTSAGFTAFQTTRLYGFFRLANRVTKLTYQYILSTVAIFTLGPYVGSLGGGTASLALDFNLADIFYLFMIPTTIAVLAAFVTLYEDATRPGERLPWDFPISRRKRRQREAEMAAYLGVPPPP